ncbi:MAG: DUF2169 domain-containing protein [Agarilytica sp.]
MLELNNKTPFHVSFAPIATLEGVDALSVFFSASLQLLDGRWSVCEGQVAAPLADEYIGEDVVSSIKYPSLLGVSKPATDLIVNGAAVSPGQNSVKALEASIEVLDRKVALHVFGDRVWNRGVITEPKPFQRLPLIWENAYGGAEEIEGELECFAHNPIGKGWKPDSASEEDFQGVFLPNIEWPDQRLSAFAQRPRPAGLGALSVTLPARARFAGTYDESWKKTRAPFLPADFNPAFFNAAIPELQIPHGLKGGETIRLINLNEQGECVFNLPVLSPIGEVYFSKGTFSLNFKLITVVVETEKMIVRMFWQGLSPIPRTLADVKEIKTLLARA